MLSVKHVTRLFVSMLTGLMITSQDDIIPSLSLSDSLKRDLLRHGFTVSLLVLEVHSSGFKDAMLLRSASTPRLRSFTEPDLGLRIKPIRSISMSLSSIKKTSSESDLRRNSLSTKKVLSTKPSIRPVLIEEETDDETDSCFGTIALFNEECGAIEMEEKVIPGVSDGIGGGVGGGGRSCGGGGGRDSDDAGRQNESMDSYYLRMINEYPGDALLLGNYARFLKEVK